MAVAVVRVRVTAGCWGWDWEELKIVGGSASGLAGQIEGHRLGSVFGVRLRLSLVSRIVFG